MTEVVLTSIYNICFEQIIIVLYMPVLDSRNFEIYFASFKFNLHFSVKFVYFFILIKSLNYNDILVSQNISLAISFIPNYIVCFRFPTEKSYLNHQHILTCSLSCISAIICLPSISATNSKTALPSSTGNVNSASMGLSSEFVYRSVEVTSATKPSILMSTLISFKGTEISIRNYLYFQSSYGFVGMLHQPVCPTTGIISRLFNVSSEVLVE